MAARLAGGCQGGGEVRVAPPGRGAGERLGLLGSAGWLAGRDCRPADRQTCLAAPIPPGP